MGAHYGKAQQCDMCRIGLCYLDLSKFGVDCVVCVICVFEVVGVVGVVDAVDVVG